MDIKYSEHREPLAIEDYLSDQLADWTIPERVLSRLVEILATKGVLTAPEVTYIAGCHNDEATFESHEKLPAN